jgi:6-phosphogluconolactonase
VYIGTYTKAEPRETNGIYIYHLEHATGALHPAGAVSGLVNPSFLALDPHQRYLYAVEEVVEHAGQPGGLISALAIDRRTGALEPINQQRTHGADPCYVSVDHTGRWVFVANYTGGSVCVLPIEQDGALGEATTVIQHSGSSVNPGRQEGPHAHSIQPDPANRFVLAADLGLDQILVYNLDQAHGTLALNRAPAPLHPGAGPRHLAFHPNGAVLYCMNELDSTITVFAYDAAQGTLSELQTIGTLPEHFTTSNSGADIHVDPAGRYLYSSNRGHDSIAVFAIDGASGLLRSAGHAPTGGRTPRNFAIDPSGTFLLAANQASDTIVTFRIDRTTGGLKRTDHEITVPRPVCVRFVTPG